MPNRPHATPQVLDLVRVVPIAASRSIDGGALVLTSVEVYIQGLLLHTLLMSNAHGPTNGFQTPQVVFEAADEVGVSYGCWTSGGYGTGASPDNPIGWWRQDYVLAPTPDARARELRLTATAIEWLRYERGHAPAVALVEPVGWTVIVPL